MLMIADIEKLSNQNRVKKIAVENFLYTVKSNPNIQSALCNLELDSKLYNWNTETVNAIRKGIIKAFR